MGCDADGTGRPERGGINGLGDFPPPARTDLERHMSPTDPVPEGIEIADPRFREVLPPRPELRTLADGLRFTEGPVWMPNGTLIFSDIPADTLYRFAPGAGLSVFRKPSRHANGNTLDLEGRLITCEHGSRTVTRTDARGEVTTLCRTYDGNRLNSPNDAVVKGDGTLWFTDPPYGLGKDDRRELDNNYVFRLDPGAEEPVAVADDFERPNGLCFSPDESKLYVADSWHRGERHVRVFHVTSDNALEGGEEFCRIDPGVPDGIRCDRDGRLYSTAGDGVHVFAPDGVLLGKILTPRLDGGKLRSAANCCFGGPEGRTLFITARDSLYAIDLAVSGD
jgi:gluconolactonase